MNEFETEMRGRIIALSYLVEISLGSILAGNPDRIRKLEEMRFALVSQLQLDYAATGPAYPSPDATAPVVRIATGVLNDHIDRLLRQFEVPAQPLGSA